MSGRQIWVLCPWNTVSNFKTSLAGDLDQIATIARCRQINIILNVCYGRHDVTTPLDSVSYRPTCSATKCDADLTIKTRQL